MKTTLKMVGTGLLGVVAFMVVLVLLVTIGLTVKKFTNEASGYTAAQHAADVAELRNLQTIYLKAEPEQKPTLRSIIVKRAREVNSANLPVELAFFIDDMQRKARSSSYTDE